MRFAGQKRTVSADARDAPLESGHAGRVDDWPPMSHRGLSGRPPRRLREGQRRFRRAGPNSSRRFCTWSSAPSRGGFRVYAGLLLMRRGDQQHASPVCERRGEEYLSPVIVNDFGVCNRPRDKKAASDYLAHRAHTRNDGAGLRD